MSKTGSGVNNGKTKKPRTKSLKEERKCIQAALGEEENISFIWDMDSADCPQNLIDLKKNLLRFSKLVPTEMEVLFTKGLPKDKGSREDAIDLGRNFKSKIERAHIALDIASTAQVLKQNHAAESRWVKFVAEKFIFKELDYSIDNSQDYLKIFDQLEMVKDVQFQLDFRTSLPGLFPNGDATIPKPDILFALPAPHSNEIELFHAHNTLRQFEREYLIELAKTKNIRTSPIPSNYNLCYPWGVYEAKKVVSEGTKEAIKVYIQIARAAAVCAALLKELSSIDNSNCLPIISFTSIGEKWEVFLCYAYESPAQSQKGVSSSASHLPRSQARSARGKKNEVRGSTPLEDEYKITQKYRYHLLRIWEGDVTNCWDALKLLHIVEYARAWVLRTFKPWVADLLDQRSKLKVCDVNLGEKEDQITQATPPSTPTASARVRPRPSSSDLRIPARGGLPPSPPLTNPRQATTTRHAGKGASLSRTLVPENLPPSPPLTDPKHATTIAATVSYTSPFREENTSSYFRNSPPSALEPPSPSPSPTSQSPARGLLWERSGDELESYGQDLPAQSSVESSSIGDNDRKTYTGDQPEGEHVDTKSEACELSIAKPRGIEGTKASKAQSTTKKSGSSSFIENVVQTGEIPIIYPLLRKFGVYSRSNTFESDKTSTSSRRSSIFGLGSRRNSLDPDKASPVQKQPPGAFPTDLSFSTPVLSHTQTTKINFAADSEPASSNRNQGRRKILGAQITRIGMQTGNKKKKGI
ncbi:hypothetical protein BDD12DRAFT_834521 [Trichophaea hybrida]|nr:hypothetical protein BDD12DRAFT_834521 [Trichophaea hybrida]